MSDFISRQAAIALADSLKDDLPDDERIADLVMAHNEGILEYQTKLSLLPSAQPESEERTAESAQNVPKEDLISRKAAIDALKDWYDGMIVSSFRGIEKVIKALPSAQPETAKRIVGKSRNGMTLWYQCDMCNEPVDAQDNFCRGCGRRLTDG